MSRIPDPELKDVFRFMSELRSYLLKQYSGDFKAGQMYRGKKEISFFTFTPLSLQRLKLKTVFVYNFDEAQVEIWLAAQNRGIQKKFHDQIKALDHCPYHVPANLRDGLSIVDHVLFRKPEMSANEKVLRHISDEGIKFIKEMVRIFKI